jgi:hypothetical protein
MASQYSMNGFVQSIDDYTYLEKYFQNRGIKDFSYTVGTEKKSRKKTSEEVQLILFRFLCLLPFCRQATWQVLLQWQQIFCS